MPRSDEKFLKQHQCDTISIKNLAVASAVADSTALVNMYFVVLHAATKMYRFLLLDTRGPRHDLRYTGYTSNCDKETV